MKQFLTILLLGIGLAPAFAQTSSRSAVAEDLLLKQVDKQDYILNDLTDDERKNLAKLQDASHNVSALSQKGVNNQAIVEQYGKGNVLELTQQGNNNSYEGHFTGDNNVNAITQTGNNNLLTQNVTTSNLQFNFVQNGDNNELNQTEDGTNTIPYRVEQTGGMKLNIVNGSAGIK